MKKKVVFNALQTTLSGGIGRYSYELAKNMYMQGNYNIKLVVREEDFSLFSFANQEDLIIAKGIKNSLYRNFYEQFILPNIVYKKYPDAIIHYPDTMAPILSKNDVVITIHDLAFKSLNDVFTKKTVLWKNFITQLSIKKAKYIIAITNFTKTEIFKHFPSLANEKVHVVYNGFNRFNQEINYSNISKEILNIPNKYILTVSTISPRKNINGLIKAFYTIKNDISHNLVIAGGNGWMYEEVYDLVKKLNLEDRVIFTGKINDEELNYLYKNADLFTYISFYEGFGLPPLEAMDHNIPCIVSNTTSLPEVVGEYAVTVNPYDVENIANKIFECLLNKDINRDYSLWLQNFSWEKCANETLEVYKKI